MDFTVKFLPSGKEVIVEAGTSLSDAAKMAGVQIATPCGGTGRCGRCIVQIDGVSGDRVLACVTYVDRDMVVIVPDKDTSEVIAAVDYMESDIGEFSPMSGGLGLAVDIGTTTVAADFIDMSTGECIASSSDVNGQKVLGDDVLARIQHVADGGTQELRDLVLRTMNDMIEECASDRVIESVYIAGNTTMEHLFVGVDPTPIREEPYVPVIISSDLVGKDSGLNVSESARVITMPCISAYVGGDITSDIVYAGMDVSEGISLLIDVGTNGEVALGNKDMMMVCSSSAGPAFEGGNLKSGMMARPGAIDSIVIEDGVAKFTGKSVVTIDHFAVYYDTASDTCPEGYHYEVLHPFGSTVGHLPYGSSVRIICHRYRETESRTYYFGEIDIYSLPVCITTPGEVSGTFDGPFIIVGIRRSNTYSHKFTIRNL